MQTTLFEAPALPLVDIEADGKWALQYFMETHWDSLGRPLRDAAFSCGGRLDELDYYETWHDLLRPYVASGGIVDWCDGRVNSTKLYFNAALEEQRDLIEDGLPQFDYLPLFGFWRDGGSLTVWKQEELFKYVKEWIERDTP